jgi:hypothetical protein
LEHSIKQNKLAGFLSKWNESEWNSLDFSVCSKVGFRHNWVVLQKYYYILFHLALSMNRIVLWASLGIFLVSGIILLKGQHTEATDYSGSTIPANSTGVLIEEEKDEDEINATTPTDIKIQRLANTSNLK